MSENLVIQMNLAKKIAKSQEIPFEDYKYSYFILKPNAQKHFAEIVARIEKEGFTIAKYYFIRDYETVTMQLHPDPKTRVYIEAISSFYKMEYGNYGILLLIGKRNITYENLAEQVCWLKKRIRERYKPQDFSLVFDISKMRPENEKQRIIILTEDGKEIQKDEMNEIGNFKVFYPNVIHSPEETVESTIKELRSLIKWCVISSTNEIPKKLIQQIKNLNTFDLLKKMLRKSDH